MLRLRPNPKIWIDGSVASSNCSNPNSKTPSEASGTPDPASKPSGDGGGGDGGTIPRSS